MFLFFSGVGKVRTVAVLANHVRALMGVSSGLPHTSAIFITGTKTISSRSNTKCIYLPGEEPLFYFLLKHHSYSISKSFAISFMAGIREWIRGKMGSKPQGNTKEQQPTHQKPLPFLPATRPRPLTLGSSGSEKFPESFRSLKNYGLLGSLPYEVRHQILVEAFGGRRLHMDLSYRHPFTRKSQNTMKFESRFDAIAINRHCDFGSGLVPDESQPEGWQWFGCVCHRRTGFSEIEKQQRYDASEYSQSIEPCDDDCLEGSGSMCSCQVGQPDSAGAGAACFIGAMGWLLACRQA